MTGIPHKITSGVFVRSAVIVAVRNQSLLAFNSAHFWHLQIGDEAGRLPNAV
jgi:hypothetical protein